MRGRAALIRWPLTALLFAAFAGGDGADALAVGVHAPTLKALRRSGRFHSLTGAWTGEYSYPRRHFGVRRVPFNARIEEAGESFTGETDEPNTFADPAAPRLFAHLAGARHGLEISFIKTMDGTGGAAHSIHYAGTADSRLSRIEGTWSVPGDWSGPFMMERSDALAEIAAERSAGVSERA